MRRRRARSLSATAAEGSLTGIRGALDDNCRPGASRHGALVRHRLRPVDMNLFDPVARRRISPYAFYSLAFIAAALLIVSRRPDTLLHADFWAEDGWRWYPEAYQAGLACLWQSWTGYLQTISRLVALISTIFPLAWAPTLFAGAAILVQATTAVFILSDRLDDVCPQRLCRALFALVYLLLPNSFEVYANLTNAQWHLGLLAFLVIAARAPGSPAGWIFDVAVLVLSGLSGPFCLFLAPVALWRAAWDHDRTSFFRASILVLCLMVQLGFLIGYPRGASPPLGAGPRRLAQILSGQVILPVLIGRRIVPRIESFHLWQNGIIPVIIVIAALPLTIRAVITGSRALRWAFFFAGCVLIAGLLRPALGPSSVPAWTSLATPDIGGRYFFLPMLAWIAVLFTLAGDNAARVRWTGRALLTLMFVMLPTEWNLPGSYHIGGRTDFVQRAQDFAAAPPGTVMDFPVHPPGVPPMRLQKR